MDGITGSCQRGGAARSPAVSVESSVGQQGVGLHLRQESVGALEVMGLARRQQKGQRIAQRVDPGMDLRAQSAPAAPDRFVALVLFLGAPALCR
jgi:hypothetical protein